jgi:hypothetical protein
LAFVPPHSSVGSEEVSPFGLGSFAVGVRTPTLTCGVRRSVALRARTREEEVVAPRAEARGQRRWRPSGWGSIRALALPGLKPGVRGSGALRAGDQEGRRQGASISILSPLCVLCGLCSCHTCDRCCQLAGTDRRAPTRYWLMRQIVNHTSSIVIRRLLCDPAVPYSGEVYYIVGLFHSAICM